MGSARQEHRAFRQLQSHQGDPISPRYLIYRRDPMNTDARDSGSKVMDRR